MRTALTQLALAGAISSALISEAAARVPCDTAVKSPTAVRALELCRGADQLPDGERNGALERGLSMAEQAVDTNACDAAAHVAVACNLGKLLEARGFGIGQLSELRRLQRELDIALSLAPQDADALAAKGALLVRLPTVFGGNARQGETLLRKALASDPMHEEARRYITELSSNN